MFGGMMGGYGGFGGAGDIIGLVFNAVVIIAVILLIVWAVRRFTTSGGWGQAGVGQSAREILQARYARGELTRAQYQKMLADLG